MTKGNRYKPTIWLEHLKQFHSGYRDIEIDRVTLTQLPENGEVLDQIAVHKIPAVDEDIDLTDLQLDEEKHEVAAIPNLLAENSELEQMQYDVVPQGHHRVAHLTPLFNTSF